MCSTVQVYVVTKNHRLLALYRPVLGSLRNQPYSTGVWYIATYSTFDQVIVYRCGLAHYREVLAYPVFSTTYTNFPDPAPP